MPIYEFRCQKGHSFEVMQRMSDDPVTQCTVCGAAVERVFHPIAVHFKGSGFYNTDYGTRNRSREKEASDGAAAKESSKSESKDSNGSKPATSEGAKKSESASTASASSSKSD